MRKIASYLVPALILIAVLALQYQFPEQIEAYQIKIFDIFQKIKPRAYEPTPVRIVDIDDESLSKLGQWPWPRTLVANLVSRMGQSGAEAIAFDAVFAEPDRTSPQNVIPLWPDNPATTIIKDQMGQIPNHDTLFAEAISQAPVVLAFGLTGQKNNFLPVRKCGFLEHGTGQDMAIDYLGPIYTGAIVNLPELEKVSRGNACFNMGAEQDSTIRRTPSLFRLNENLYPALSLETLRVFQGASTYKINLAGATGEASFGEKTGIVGIKVGRIDVPTDGRGRIWLYDTGYKPSRYIPAWKILTDDSTLPSLEGKILFVGSSATGIKDLRSTPLNPRAAGVEVHAQLVEQMLLENFLKRPDWAAGAEFSFLVLLSLLLIILLPLAGAVLCAVIGFTAIASAIGLSWYAFSQWHLLIDPIFPSVTILLIYIVSSFLNFLRTEKEKGQIRGAFSRYLSPVLVEKLAKDPKQLKLGGEIRNMTFLFTDIRNFTGIAEKFKPEELTQFMNKFLTPMTDIVLKHNGTIDKYIGDCIMAFWNAPLEDRDHASHACLAALDMQKLILEWNHTYVKENPLLPVLKIGIGINTGTACVGNMGSEQRFDYTVLGDHVNLASRLESLSKNYGVTTVLGENTALAFQDSTLLELDLIRVKGKKEPTKIFALLGNATYKTLPRFKEVRESYEKMLLAYRSQRWEEAERHLEICRKITLEEIDLGVLYELYASRILSYKINPPASDWDGVTIATSK